MRHKGFLRTPENVYLLSPKITTVGREGCDLLIQSPVVDDQHAVIEFVESEDCFVLKDLDTNQGTYVNDCRIQHASVRLSPGDVIRFGYPSPPYEFGVESAVPPVIPTRDVIYPPVAHPRPSWQQPSLRLVPDSGSVPLPNITGPPTYPQRTTSQQQPLQPVLNAWGAPYPPARSSSRPSSASRRQGVPPRGGWVAGPGRDSPVDEAPDVEGLRQQVSAMQMQLGGLADNQVRSRLSQLEAEVAAKKAEVATMAAEATRRAEKLEAAVAGKDATIARLGREVETLRKGVEEGEEGKREADALRQKFRVAESKVEEQSNFISTLKADLDSASAQLRNRDDQLSSAQQQLDARTQDLQEAQGAYQALRADMDALRARLSQLRVSAVATICPERQGEEIEDAEMSEMLAGMRTRLAVAQAAAEEVESRQSEERRRWAATLSGLNERLRAAQCRSSALNAEATQLADVEGGNEVKEGVVACLRLQGEWLHEVEAALDSCGYSDRDTHPKEQILNLKARLETALAEVQEEGKLRESLQKEKEEALKETTIAAEERYKAMEEALAEKEAQLEETREQERRKVEELNISIAELERSLLEKSADAGASGAQELQSRISDLETALAQSITEASTAGAQLEETQSQLTAVSLQAAETQQELDQARARVHTLVQSAVERVETEDARSSTQQEAEVERLTSEVERLLRECAVSNAEVTRLTGELAAKEEEVEVKVEINEEVNEVKAEAAKSDGDWVERPEIAAYKEQVRQHALTIVSLEERLEAVVKQNQEFQGRVADLSKENKNLRKRRSRQQQQESGQTNNQSIEQPPLAAVMVPRAHVEVAAMERSLLGLRQENANLKKTLVDREKTVDALRQDLSGAAARLSDMAGELTDEQKEEVWAAKAERQELQARLDEALSKLAQLSKMVDGLNETISRRDEELLAQTKAVDSLTAALREKDAALEEAKDERQRERDENAEQRRTMEDEGRINAELSAIGAQCRGERHTQIIHHQKEALAELRTRVKKLDNVRAPHHHLRGEERLVRSSLDLRHGPGLPTHDQAVQQVVLLKKELAELRATHALRDSNLPTFPALLAPRPESGPAPAPANDSLVPQAALEQQRVEMTASLEQERTAHRQTMRALEQSEKSVNDALRSLASAIQLEAVAGIASIAHLSEDEREMVTGERMAAVEAICQRIAVLQERLSRKEELLQNYEQDLARLQQAEMLASKKHDQVEKLVKDVRARTEETTMLRQSLNNTREVLNREKLLNEAIKQKKTFHMEVQKMPKPPSTPNQQPRMHCPRDDIFNKEQKRKQKVKEREKRKDYEISTLKTRLTARERELCRATTRLATIETTLGLTGEPELE